MSKIYILVDCEFNFNSNLPDEISADLSLVRGGYGNPIKPMTTYERAIYDMLNKTYQGKEGDV